MPLKLHLRPATPADVPRMIEIFIAAFSPGPWSALLFPPNQRTRPGQADETEWRVRVFRAQLEKPGHHHVLAVQQQGEQDSKQEVVVGWANWLDTARDTTVGMTPEEKRADLEKTWGSASPPGLDRTAWEEMGRQGEVVNEMAREALGVERLKESLELRYLMIDPIHQRKGAGRLLMQEYLDSAATEEKDVWLRATADGRPLYLSLGFKEVGQGLVMGNLHFAMVKRAAGGGGRDGVS
ncbi:hypothetical protein M406DRAFT_32690 [Cryphonectria parasitica EP155]|uniref:N-acetyltransferase domain-containing protein n=1 Tax=Cryphonectria parasitica (strain ATCC 38755 / EP155) TaxID=660469 RepID=A0A9P4YD27_CRYP1|nr:uncharacterized protein M406DRAFT_32690 [Cryphonectria parasitica EP155]KAF3771133.1 hypothetical protein M406DRAFT_32690 [Cryphonectria parasitica EP155]